MTYERLSKDYMTDLGGIIVHTDLIVITKKLYYLEVYQITFIGSARNKFGQIISSRVTCTHLFNYYLGNNQNRNYKWINMYSYMFPRDDGVNLGIYMTYGIKEILDKITEKSEKK